MNERQPYEQLIADKLQRLPSPGADASWQKMKRLLDDEDNKTGGGKNGPGRNGGWWKTGLIVLLFISGIWFYTENRKPAGKDLSAVTQKNNNASSQQVSDESNKSNNNKTNATGNNSTPNTSTVNSAQQNTAASNNPADNISTEDNTATKSTANNNHIVVSATNNKKVIANNNNPLPGNTISTGINSTKPRKENMMAEKNPRIIKDNETSTINNRPANLSAVNNTIAANKNSKPLKKISDNNRNTSGGRLIEPGDKNNNVPGVSLVKNNDSKKIFSNTKYKRVVNAKAGENIKNNTRDNTELVNNKPANANQLIKKEKGKNANRYIAANTEATTTGDNTGISLTGTSDLSVLKDNPAKTANHQKENNVYVTGNNPIEETTIAKQQSYYERLNELKIPFEYSTINTSLSIADSIESNRDVNKLLSKEAKAMAAKAQRAKAEEELAKKTKKSLKLNLGSLFKPFSLHVDAEPWWAAGFALNNYVAVNAQSRYNYNVNARSGTLSDYIPSPYVQFHLNDYVYMQTELNLSTPQLTPQLLLYQKSGEVVGAAGYSQQKSIYVQKLYYFNWPVSLHYSPVNNLYIAAGLQFSSFQSGLALIQNKRYYTQAGNPNDPIYTDNSVQKFKDDSLAAKLSPTEWRWQTGADDYWNRFTLGLRYNKAFKDLLNVNVASSLPLTTNRNSAFLFFMRYNLFEGRKKGNTGPTRNLVRY